MSPAAVTVGFTPATNIRLMAQRTDQTAIPNIMRNIFTIHIITPMQKCCQIAGSPYRKRSKNQSVNYAAEKQTARQPVTYIVKLSRIESNHMFALVLERCPRSLRDSRTIESHSLRMKITISNSIRTSGKRTIEHYKAYK